MSYKTKCPAQKQPSTKLNDQLNNNSSASQRQRLLEWLRNKPINTIEARHKLDIMMPGPRIHELRHKHGYNIIKYWKTDITPEGYKHRVAQYVLLPGKFKGGKK